MKLDIKVEDIAVLSDDEIDAVSGAGSLGCTSNCSGGCYTDNCQTTSGGCGMTSYTCC